VFRGFRDSTVFSWRKYATIFIRAKNASTTNFREKQIKFYASYRSFMSTVFFSKQLMGIFFKSSIFWGVMLCSPLKVNRRFVGTCCLHFRVEGKAKQEINVKAGDNVCCLSMDYYDYKIFLLCKVKIQELLE
jgi:hypothetical protein